MKPFVKWGDSLPLPAFYVLLADSLAEKLEAGDFADGADVRFKGLSEEDSHLMRMLLLHLGLQSERGHLRTNLKTLKDDFNGWYSQFAEFNNFDETLAGRLADRLDSLVKAGIAGGLIVKLSAKNSFAEELTLPRPPLVLSPDGNYLYFLRFRRQEDSLIQGLQRRCTGTSASKFPLPANFNKVSVRESGKETPEAKLMKQLSKGSRLLILSGGPGTGKTTTVGKLVSMMKQGRKDAGMPKPKIMAAAPTGRAAARMSEGLKGLTGKTLHSIIGIAPHRAPRHNKNNPLNTELLIVDEASMVDVFMMNLILEALPPSAALLLVGDPNQLPSVEAGALLADLLDGASLNPQGGPLNKSVVTLKKVYRSNTEILKSAEALKDGNMTAFMESLESSSVEFHPVPSPEEMAQKIAAMYKQNIKQYSPFEAYSRHTVLTPLRKGPMGVPALNRQISILFGGTELPFEKMPIVVMSNDARRNLWNGDRAVIEKTQDGIKAVFPPSEPNGKERKLPLAALKSWEPAWIQTIHKSQGSEFNEVDVILPPESGRLLTREILYTAFTRAKEKVRLYSDKETVQKALSQRVVRLSRVSEWASGNRRP